MLMITCVRVRRSCALSLDIVTLPLLLAKSCTILGLHYGRSGLFPLKHQALVYYNRQDIELGRYAL